MWQRNPGGRVNRRPVPFLHFTWLRGEIVLLLVAVGLSLLLSSSVHADFSLSTTLLSSQDSTCDIEPRAGISDDGQWLAVVWIKGVKGSSGNQGCKSRGQAQISWASEASTMTGWQGPYTLPLPTGACADHADVDVVGTTAHVVVGYWQPCDDLEASSGIRYFTCNLATGNCSDNGDAVSQDGSAGFRLFDARIAADEQDRLHVVYSRASHGLSAGEIFYTRYVNGTWSSPVLVSTGAKYDGFYRPAVAASGGRVHITWERHRNISGTQRHYTDAQYRYCEAATGNCPESGLVTYADPYPSVLYESTDALPTVAARGGRVMLSWNVCADINPNPPCESFYLLYARSDNNGLTLSSPREVGSDSGVNLLQHKYSGGDNGVGLVNQYAAYARPVIALNKDALPYVAWQIQTAPPPEDHYVISTTYAITATSQGFVWKSEEGWQLGDGEDARIAPAIVLPDGNGIHFFYMSAWKERIGLQEASRSQIYYDYVGNRRPSLTTEVVPTTHPLPEERAVQLRVRVRDGTGANIAGEQITFSTDYGSFNYLGFDAQKVTVTSNAEGLATPTLYSNMTGTAHCRAWIDSISNGAWDIGEPTVTFTQTWADPLTPTLLIGAGWASPGDLITATLVHHPYELPSFVGAAAQYVLWWCPSATQAAGPLSVDIESWARQDLVLQIPWSMSSGTYYLESRIDEEGAEPCVGTDYTARSSDIQISTTPPAGPWLVIGDNQPNPGATITTTLRDHNAGSYELWWCPASLYTAPISQTVKEVTVASGEEPTVAFVVPKGVQGLYRLETHAGSGACGDTRTRYAVSALLHPRSQVFLPLITRATR